MVVGWLFMCLWVGLASVHSRPGSKITFRTAPGQMQAQGASQVSIPWTVLLPPGPSTEPTHRNPTPKKTRHTSGKLVEQNSSPFRLATFCWQQVRCSAAAESAQLAAVGSGSGNSCGRREAGREVGF